MSVQGVTALITAAAGLLTALGALLHSRGTRRQVRRGEIGYAYQQRAASAFRKKP
jgi:hypothetical protein